MSIPEGVDRDSMMTQAQNIWTMLDEMSERDPQAYKKFIDKHMKEGKEYMKPPEPHMCVMTMTTNMKGRYFINFCSWNKVPEPKTPEDAIPVIGTPVLQDKDENGDFSYSGVAFNPKILEEFGIDCNLQVLMKAFQGKNKNTDDEFDEHLSEMEKTFGLQGLGAKDSLLNKLANLSTEESVQDKNAPNIQLPGLGKEHTKKQNLIQEMNSSNSEQVCETKEPDYKMEEKFNGEDLEKLLLTIKLPGVNKVSECELDISEDDIDLTVEDRYHLNLSFPYLINDAKASAKFNKNNSSLIITLPVQT
uniref:PIH1 domain-containing protein 2 n=1 Tax=Magallana gigas TaxID=29159 RepID=A0A8W8L238_MAGGI